MSGLTMDVRGLREIRVPIGKDENIWWLCRGGSHSTRCRAAEGAGQDKDVQASF